MGRNQQILAGQCPRNVQELYDKYSGMLFGYIYGVVKDAGIAEQQLVNFYSTIKDHLHEINADGAGNTWCKLQSLLKKHLSASGRFIECDVMTGHSGNKYFGMMSDEQKYVFCNIYYHGRSTAELALILNKPEEQVRKELKEAFTILRQGT